MTAGLSYADGCCAMVVTDWPSIVRQHGPLVWKTVYRLLNQEADAADCFQETFVCALELARRQTVQNWAGLLSRMATARALDQLRRRIRQRQRIVSDHGDTDRCDAQPSKQPGPLEYAQGNELSERLRVALGELPPRHSEAFCLRHVSGLSYGEIAEEMGVSVDAVGVLLHRARRRLQELLMGRSC
jgi:RNA polymerase sigma-70 factor (ECF subfamily)